MVPDRSFAELLWTVLRGSGEWEIPHEREWFVWMRLKENADDGRRERLVGKGLKQRGKG